MPYLPSEAAKKSQKYNNIINGDIREYQSEINDLARRVSRDFNEVQKIGIDLNGLKGSCMFSINSMKAENNQNNNSNFNIEIVIDDEDKIKQTYE